MGEWVSYLPGWVRGVVGIGGSHKYLVRERSGMGYLLMLLGDGEGESGGKSPAYLAEGGAEGRVTNIPSWGKGGGGRLPTYLVWGEGG